MFREGIVRNIEERNDLSERADAVKDAFSEDSSDALSSEQRMEVLQAAQLGNNEN